MTAFARVERQSSWGAITWELKSVNHRYLEVLPRLPDTLRALETQVRERVAGLLSRGKVDCTLKFHPTGDSPVQLTLNRPLAKRLLEVAGELEQLIGPGSGLAVGEVLRWPGVVSEPEPDQEVVKVEVLEALDDALGELVATRKREGERTAAMIRTRLEAMAEQVALVRQRRPEVVERLRERLWARLAELPAEPDSQRLEQEMVYVAQRMDVEEELDRLEAHLAEVRSVLKRREPVGRRLDFLMQEFNREANTLSSKSNDGETTRAAVELKVLIEQLREQVQNIE
ncbi:MAG: YicC/YloC family endoribonuclease [Candidatus Competibacteraceae bacterium]|nr:YicC/YloC family endoribonuclease [Candidatus Competibacteraceae bacterium]